MYTQEGTLKIKNMLINYQLCQDSYNKSTYTTKTYIDNINLFISYINTEYKVCSHVKHLTLPKVKKYVAHIIDLVVTGTIGFNTFKNRANALKSLFNFLKDYYLNMDVIFNYISKLNTKNFLSILPTNYVPDVIILSDEQINIFCKTTSCVKDDHIRRQLLTYINLLKFYGLRKSDALGITWKNINFEEKTLTFFRTKTSNWYTVNIYDGIYNLLKELYKSSMEKTNVQKSDFIFKNLSTNKNSIIDIDYYFKILNIQSNLNISSKHFRSNLVYKMIINGYPEEFIIKLLGHYNKETLKYYFDILNAYNNSKNNIK